MHLCTLGSLILIEPFTHTLHNSFFGIRYLPKVWCLLWPRSYACFENFVKSIKFISRYLPGKCSMQKQQILYRPIKRFCQTALSDCPLQFHYWRGFGYLFDNWNHAAFTFRVLSESPVPLSRGRGIIYFCFCFLMELFAALSCKQILTSLTCAPPTLPMWLFYSAV